ncbi:MAG: cytochrome-c oxidase, cbb3-type subunit I [Planctomycetes bacterium]|jgi:cytochrome c oxidase cbb3-type subunit I/II|nr:cytochrome-c oxidase, cbb3-type subunit I [Planctomycetota bacterium]
MHTATVTETRRVVYNDALVRGFVWASVGWGLIGLLVGLVIALQLSFPALNADLPFLTFSRLRPLHTNAVIFALVGNMMFAGIYYSTQRLLKTRMASDLLGSVHLWGWQLIILGAAVTLPLGITQSKEYAELEWPLDILVVLVWVAFAVNFFWTLAIRNEKSLYVSLWFYISTILTIAVLYIVNNLALPVTMTKSYGVFAGAQDALTQWWYGHNAVAFFLTTPILGIMYYFLPKAADRPVFSYRLSIVHFWALVFIYIWAGPHHLLNTALPDWAQSLGMVFSLMLWAPSWGGMLNGLLTLRGAFYKVRTDPVLKFFVAGVTFYGMATFEGPLLSIKSVSALGHYTDWIIGHVHGGALGWNGFMAAGMFYWLVPKLYGTKLHSTKIADYHFWIGMVGILLYVASMWISGVSQGLMWRAENADGSLQYPDWNEILNSQQMMYMARSFGGLLFVAGWAMMFYNLIVTAMSGRPVTVDTEVTVTRTAPLPGEPTSMQLVRSKPVIICVLGLIAATMFGMPSIGLAVLGLVLLLAIIAFAGGMIYKSTHMGRHTWHEQIESRPLAFSVLTLIAVVIGGVYELVPGLVLDKEVPLSASGEVCVKPYTPLELTGRDLYVREGCYVCHSQMIRPFRSEFVRYGAPSRIEESMYDHPFQWGSKRTGPDLARVGAKYDEAWHWDHMRNPRSTSPASIMPGYPWMFDAVTEPAVAADKMRVLKKLGVPYTDAEIAGAVAEYARQADEIVAALKTKGKADASGDREIVALIAYLRRLGNNLEPVKSQAASIEGGK